MTVKASDKGRPQLEDVCTLSVKVKDKNDNKPIFDRGQYDEPVAQDTPVGTQIMRVSATDVDEGENQKISYDLSATRIPGLLIIILSLLFLSGVDIDLFMFFGMIILDVILGGCYDILG